MSVSVHAHSDGDTRQQIQVVMDGIAEYKIRQSDAANVEEWLGGALSQGAGTGSEWYVMALSQNGEYDFSSYEAALLGYLEKNEVYSASTRQKYALALCAVGSTDSYISSVLGDSIGKQGIMSWVFGLHLLNNGYEGEYSAEYVVDKLVSLQCEDGGWSLTGQSGDVDVSAMTVQALAVYRESNAKVSAAVDRALELLSNRQCEDGDYMSYGEKNPESTAQVLVALCSLGIDALEDERFIKNGNTVLDGILKYRLDDGSFCHTVDGATDERSTEQIYFGCAAYLRMMDGKSPVYVFDRRDPQGVSPAPQMPQTDKVVIDSGTDITDGSHKQIGYKPLVCIIVAVVGGIVCVVLWLMGKRSAKNFIAVWVAVAVCVAVVCVTDIKSSDEYYNGEGAAKESVVGSVTLTISCHTVVGKTESEYIPKDGVILNTVSLDIEADDTVYDVLVDAARKYNIHVENNGSADMAYIVGINYLYEFDFGDLSGWEYRVNGASPSVGCGQYAVKDGDDIRWIYTCELGNDLK